MELFIKFVSTGAHPAYLLCRRSQHQGMIGYVPCHNSPRDNKRISANCVAADNGAVRPQGGPFFDKGRSYFVHAPDVRPGIDDISEDHAWAAEHVVFQGCTFEDGDVILNFAAISNVNVRSDHNILTDIAGFTYPGTREDM